MCEVNGEAQVCHSSRAAAVLILAGLACCGSECAAIAGANKSLGGGVCLALSAPVCICIHVSLACWECVWCSVPKCCSGSCKPAGRHRSNAGCVVQRADAQAGAAARRGSVSSPRVFFDAWVASGTPSSGLQVTLCVLVCGKEGLDCDGRPWCQLTPL